MPETQSHPRPDGLRSAEDAREGACVPIALVREADLEAVFGQAGAAARALAAAQDFRAQDGRLLLVPGPDGALLRVLYGLGTGANPMALRGLPGKLPPGDYRFEALGGFDPALAVLAWSLGGYRFDRYKSERDKADKRPVLAVDGAVDLEAVRRTAHAAALARDMVNTPANDLGPLQIETIAREIAQAHGGVVSVTIGEALIEAGYPAVHAVGRAAAPGREPRMIELTWAGAGPDAPRLAIVGKGVVFDTGGLDIKPSAGMRLMKKDMGGAAHALALARLVMGAALPVRLTVLLPVVENAISGDAMRPGDVIASRKGLSIEVGNTDAEGRLILADALTRAGELSPDLTIDLATLTGAARVALGPEVIPFFTDDDALAAALSAASAAVFDPLWRLPLWAGYGESLNSDVADLANDPAGWAQAGCVTAALFLQRFAPQSGSWVHFDVFAWNGRGRPGWPVGGEAQAIRALFHVLQDALRRRRVTLATLIIPASPLRAEPEGGAEQVDQLLFGEGFEEIQRIGGWSHGEALRDGYRGWTKSAGLLAGAPAPTHRVAALRTVSLAEPRLKAAAGPALSLNALVRVDAESAGYAQVRHLGWVPARHLAPLGTVETEPAAVAERFLGAPYLWGGRDSIGLDCSGLVQQALYACGRACRRDSDDQARMGAPIDRMQVRRGDLVFWRGHVAMMIDGRRIIHATAHHMAVTVEGLDETIARRLSLDEGPPTDFRRLAL